MFGYVTVFKEQLSEADYTIFRSYYCGLCKAMGRRCSQLSRLGLSYDITFLAIILSSVLAEENETAYGGCIAHPFKRDIPSYSDAAVEYAADAGVILNYLKLLDDWRDDGSVRALMGIIGMRRGIRRAAAKRRELYGGIRECLDRLGALEREGCTRIDATADCFAKILETLFTPEFITDKNTGRALAWLGYNIGRWIYVIDALNDMEKDYRRKSYNTFNAAFDGGDYEEYVKRIKGEQELTLTFTLDNAASAFELLGLKRNAALARSIIYDCLKTKQKQILENCGAAASRRS